MQRSGGDEQLQSSPIDFAFVTALPIERDALLRRLEGHEVVQDDFEPLTYYRGHISIPATGEYYEVVVVMLLGMGNDEAAVSTVRVIERWRRSEERRVGKECRSLCDWSSDVCSSDLHSCDRRVL